MTGFIHSAAAQNPTPHLDKHSYALTGDAFINLTNKVIIVQSNMTNCQQANGDLPLDTNPAAMYTNSQFVGLSEIKYNLFSNIITFNSETNDVVCDNGVFVETLFSTAFE